MLEPNIRLLDWHKSDKIDKDKFLASDVSYFIKKIFSVSHVFMSPGINFQISVPSNPTNLLLWY